MSNSWIVLNSRMIGSYAQTILTSYDLDRNQAADILNWHTIELHNFLIGKITSERGYLAQVEQFFNMFNTTMDSMLEYLYVS